MLRTVGAWCFTSRKALFLRPEAPRHSGRLGLQRLGRGASPPAKPCSFVRRHHATRAEWTFGGWDVVLHLPQSLVPSSGSTTPLGPNRSSAVGTWCFTSRKALFLRPEAPRHSERIRAVPGSVNSPESVNKTPTSKRMFEGRCFCFLFGFCDFTRIFSFRHVVKIRVPLHSPRSRGGTPVPLFPLQNYLRSRTTFAPAELASSDSVFATPVALLLFSPVVAMLHPLHSPRSRGGTPVPLSPLQNYLRSYGAR